jgi:hypothetical protein
MKISKEHFEHMRSEIDKHIQSIGGWKVWVERYETGNFSRSDRVKDLNVRFCWDCFYATPGLNSWTCDTLPKDIHDAHITTALKAICPTITRRFTIIDKKISQ